MFIRLQIKIGNPFTRPFYSLYSLPSVRRIKNVNALPLTGPNIKEFALHLFFCSLSISLPLHLGELSKCGGGSARPEPVPQKMIKLESTESGWTESAVHGGGSDGREAEIHFGKGTQQRQRHFVHRHPNRYQFNAFLLTTCPMSVATHQRLCNIHMGRVWASRMR